MLNHINNLPHDGQSFILIENYAKKSTKRKTVHTKSNQLAFKVVICQANINQEESRDITWVKHEYQDPRLDFIVDVYHCHDNVNYTKDFFGLRWPDIISFH